MLSRSNKRAGNYRLYELAINLVVCEICNILLVLLANYFYILSIGWFVRGDLYTIRLLAPVHAVDGVNFHAERFGKTLVDRVAKRNSARILTANWGILLVKLNYVGVYHT